MKFKSDNTKAEFYSYFFGILLFVIWGVFLTIETIEGSGGGPYEQMLAFVILTAFIIMIMGEFKKAFFTVTFKEKGFSYKYKFFREKFIYYEDVKYLKLIKKRVRGYFSYTIKVVPYKGRSAKFNVTHSIKIEEQDKFINEMEKRIGMEAELRKGTLF